MITGEEWDTHWWRIYNDALIDRDDGSNVVVDKLAVLADRECTDEFGERPAEETAK